MLVLTAARKRSHLPGTSRQYPLTPRVLSMVHGAGEDGRSWWQCGGHRAGRTVTTADTRAPVCFRGKDNFWCLLEHRATK